MTRLLFESKWFSEQAQKEVSRDVLSLGDRIGEVASIIVSIVTIAFVAIHQTRPTGFFTGDSGGVAAAVIYALIVFGMVAPALRLALGRRNVVRPLEAASLGAFAAGGLYLMASFPFDITRLAQPLPHYLEFLLDWIPGVAREVGARPRRGRVRVRLSVHVHAVPPCQGGLVGEGTRCALWVWARGLA